MGLTGGRKTCVQDAEVTGHPERGSDAAKIIATALEASKRAKHFGENGYVVAH